MIGKSAVTNGTFTTDENATITSILEKTSAESQFPNGIKFAVIITYNSARNPGEVTEVSVGFQVMIYFRCAVDFTTLCLMIKVLPH